LEEMGLEVAKAVEMVAMVGAVAVVPTAMDLEAGMAEMADPANSQFRQHIVHQ